MTPSKIMSCLLCLTLMAGAAGAQSNQPQNSADLRKMIEDVEGAAPASGASSAQIYYRRTLLRRYDDYVSSLRRDVADLGKLRATLGPADADTLKEIDADVERLTGEIADADAKTRALRGELEAGAGGEAEAAETQQQAASRPGSTLDSVKTQLPCNCPDSLKDKPPYGLIWCEKVGESGDHKLNVQKLAELAAPILWFSPDEPRRRDGKILPDLIPGDPNPSNSPVVYYRISRVKLSPSSPITKEKDGKMPVVFQHDTADFELKDIRGFTLIYYFYYPRDSGFKGHAHDLESLRLDVHVTARDGGHKEVRDPAASGAKAVSYYALHVSTFLGAAHGVTWFYNQLDSTKDTSLPITILVEEGKHASTPDRNADGSYSPGYDVNRKYNDAWGVRDVIGSGQLGGVKYEGSMTKPRVPTDMIAVDTDEATQACLLQAYRGRHRDVIAGLKAPRERYELRRVDPNVVALAKKVVEKEKADLKRSKDERKLSGVKLGDDEDGYLDIGKIMERDELGEVTPRHTHGDTLAQKAFKYGLGIQRGENARDALTVSYRYDGGHGFSFAPPVGRYPLPVFGGYVLPKANLILFGKDKRYSLEAMYTPSAARSFDWYASIGSEWFKPQDRDFDAKFVSEGGIKFRFPLKQLFGVRLGLRTTGRDQRVVFEFGAGAF